MSGDTHKVSPDIDFEELFEAHFCFAVLELHLTPEEFWSLTFHEFNSLLRYYRTKLQYDQYCAGLTPSILYNIHKPKNAKALNPLDFFSGNKDEDQGKIVIRDSETLKKIFLPLFKKT